MPEREPALTIRQADPAAPEAALLLHELNTALAEITGSSGAASFDAAEMKQPRAVFLIAWLAGQPMGCGALRTVDAETAEIKRVYARKNTVGVGRRLLQALEEQAITFGYRRILLETRAVNFHAVQFYENNGYQHCPNYGKYWGRPEACCFCKEFLIAS